MTIILTDEEFIEEQLQGIGVEQLKPDATDKLDVIQKFHNQISQGWSRRIQLREGIFIKINHYQPTDCLKLIYHSERECRFLKFSFALSAIAQWNVTSILGETILPCITGTYLVRSNGLTLKTFGNFSDVEPYSFIEVFIKPSKLRSFVASPERAFPLNLQHLVKPSNQEIYYLQTRDTQPAMNTVLQQILHCPYQGIVKRAFLESKAIELIALVLDHEVAIGQGEAKKSPLKPEQIERIHYAKEILLKN